MKRAEHYQKKLCKNGSIVRSEPKLRTIEMFPMKTYTTRISDNKLLPNLEPPKRNEKLRELEDEPQTNHKSRMECN